MRGPSQEQAASVVALLGALVEYFARHPLLIPDVAAEGLPDDEGAALHAAVGYVAGMTDRFACRSAVALLDWPVERLPTGIDR